MLVMVSTPHRRVGIQDHRPFVFFRNGEKGILPCLDGLAAKCGILCKYQDGRLISPAAIGLAIRSNGSPENIPPLLVGTAIINRDVLPLDRIMRAVRVSRLRGRIAYTTHQ